MDSEYSEVEGCYCLQGLKCPHWNASHRRSDLLHPPPHPDPRSEEKEDRDHDHRRLIHELQRELRVAMMEIEKVTMTCRDLAKANQELEEARLVAVSEQVRTGKRLVLVSSQLEHTEQQLFNLTTEMSQGQKDSDLLRVERIKHEALQEREDAGRVEIAALQDELHEVQSSERSLKQKLLIVQTKYEALGKRHDQLKRQQQELELVRESKEALAWLKETTDRLCSPPQGSLGQAIQQEKAQQGINVHQAPSSSSPPYPSAIAEPPLVAQNQLISLVKELATANSTLRTELGEYRELLQDARNEVISLRAQVEDYEQGQSVEGCDHCMEESDMHNHGLGTLAELDSSTHPLKGHHGVLSSSPPPYMSTPMAPTEQHVHHHHIHLPGVRGNIFGELERCYHQKYQGSSHDKRRRSSHKKEVGGGGRRSSHSKPGRSHHATATTDGRSTATVSTGTSTSETRRSPGSSQTPFKSSDPMIRRTKPPLPKTRAARGTFYTDADMDFLDSESDRDTEQRKRGGDDYAELAELMSEIGEEESDQDQGFVSKLAEVRYNHVRLLLLWRN
ncbi:hypothetical protein BGX31_009439 [Mortierella sp. GBA43]|nr:hypothetical protein BGX31_009439 [Mortierella sp. GBA43]